MTIFDIRTDDLHGVESMDCVMERDYCNISQERFSSRGVHLSHHKRHFRITIHFAVSSVVNERLAFNLKFSGTRDLYRIVLIHAEPVAFLVLLSVVWTLR